MPLANLRVPNKFVRATINLKWPDGRYVYRLLSDKDRSDWMFCGFLVVDSGEYEITDQERKVIEAIDASRGPADVMMHLEPLMG